MPLSGPWRFSSRHVRFWNLQALWVAPPTVFEHYVVQDLSICARFGSTSELNARSQPSSARPGVGRPVEMESSWPGRAIGGSNGCRSPLVARLTEMVITVALSAVTGLGNVLMAPAIRALKRQAAEKLLRTGSLRFARPT